MLLSDPRDRYSTAFYTSAPKKKASQCRRERPRWCSGCRTVAQSHSQGAPENHNSKTTEPRASFSYFLCLACGNSNLMISSLVSPHCESSLSARRIRNFFGLLKQSKIYFAEF